MESQAVVVCCRARIKQNGEWTIIQTAFGEGIAGRVAQTGTSMNIPDAYACGIFNPAIDRATGFVTKSVLCCPVADISGKHVAVIQARTTSAHFEALQTLQTVVGSALLLLLWGRFPPFFKLIELEGG